MMTGPMMYRSAYAVTKHDTNPLTGGPCDALYVGGAGVVAVKTNAGTVVEFTAPAGGYIWCRANLVMSTGTTATLIVALYS